MSDIRIFKHLECHQEQIKRGVCNNYKYDQTFKYVIRYSTCGSLSLNCYLDTALILHKMFEIDNECLSTYDLIQYSIIDTFFVVVEEYGTTTSTGTRKEIHSGC